MVHDDYKLLILGGTSSLGRAILENSKILDFDVTATYRHDLLELKKKNHITWFPLDIESKESCHNFLKMYSFLNPDCVIFTIGKLSESTHDISHLSILEQYLQTYAVNYPLLITQMAKMQEFRRQRLYFFNISSRSALLGSYDSSYAVTKSVVHVLMKSLPKIYGNRLTCFNFVLGLIENSNMFKKMSEQEQQNHRDRAGGRLMKIEDCADEIIEYMKSTMSYPAESQDTQTDIAIGPQYL